MAIMETFDPPNNLRRIFGAALAELNAPEHIIDHVNDMDIEDGVIAPIYSAAHTLYEIHRELDGELEEDDVRYGVEDACIELLKRFSSPMEWGPGETPGDGGLDAGMLADLVVSKIMEAN